MFVGVGAARVRDLFAKAKKNAPAVIFIDELDAIGRQRGTGLGGSHDEREQTLNQILVEMDGFETDTRVIIMAATNRPDVLDPALLRPGRFDRRVVLDLPDKTEREAILKIHSRGKPIADDVNLSHVASNTAGFSGADLKNLMNEAAILAARENRKQVHTRDVDQAIEKVMLGPERRSRMLSDEEKKITAYHEAGHAIVGHLLPNTDPIHKVSIISRGTALGYTWSRPENDRFLTQRNKFTDEIAQLLGGRVAEELIFGEISTGAHNDLDKATRLARNMVTVYGMSEALGPVVLGEREEVVFLGRELGERRNYSEEIAAKIDAEITKLVLDGRKTATEVLKKNRALLDKLAAILLKQETIEQTEFEALFV
jgi:cell division protease FtsH